MGDNRVSPIEAKFLTSAAALRDCPVDDVPEVAFVGRSNAGKSSTLNRLTGTRKLARVSKTPGRTQLINFFDTQLGGRLVDLPGYGYAKASRARQASWSAAVDDYLQRRDNLVAVVLVMDARHPLQPFDIAMIDWAVTRLMPLTVLLNKSDKLKQGQRAAARRTVMEKIGANERIDVVVFSAQTGAGAQETIALVSAYLRSM